MDLNEIREIIEIDGGKFIVVENGKPVMVVTSFDDYKQRIKGKKTTPVSTTVSFPEKVVAEKKARIPKELEDEPLKIEDLPFR